MLLFQKGGLLIAAVGAAAIATIAASPSTTESRPTSQPFTVGCFDALDRSANTTVVSLLGNEGRSAEQICLAEWRNYQGQTITDPLITCVVPGGGTGVFPNPTSMNQDEACASIGAFLPADNAAYGGLTAQQVRRLDEDIARRYEATWEASGPSCEGAETLRHAADQGIQAMAADNWKIVDRTTSAGKTCAHFLIDALEANVILIDGDL